MTKKKYHVLYTFKDHTCTLDPEQLSCLTVECGFFRRLFMRFCLVSDRDLRTRRVYRSYASLVREQQRHYHLHPYTIHPLSKFRAVWEAYMAIILIVYFILLPIRYAKYKIPPGIWWTTVLIDISGVFDVALNFCTGFFTGTITKIVVLDRKAISSHYVRTHLLGDLLPSISMVSKWSDTVGVRSMLLFVSIKALRIATLLKYTDNWFERWNLGIVKCTIIKVATLMMLYIQYNIFFQFSVEYLIEGSFYPTQPRECSWMTIANMWNETLLNRYIYAFDRAVAMMRQNANMNLVEKDGCDESFYIVAWIISKYLFYHCVFKILAVAISSDSATSKYFMMTRQVETYVRLKKLPTSLKKKIIKYYSIRFQSSFFVESHIIDCVSGQLHEDIIMHTASQLVKNVPFLDSLPKALLMHIALRLKVEVFLAGDVIMKVNTLGNCVYFIDKGTVAIFSFSGREVCHLEDGDYFGEIAMVMKRHFRIVSAIAVTNCELFRLDREYFEGALTAYPEVYENVKKVALSRSEKTSVLDEQYRLQLKMRDNRPVRLSDQDCGEDILF